MFRELFEIAKDFFTLGIIPSVIGMVWIFVSCIKNKGKRYSFITSLLLAISGAIGIFIIVCAIIYLFLAITTFIVEVGFIIIIIVLLCWLGLKGDL